MGSHDDAALAVVCFGFGGAVHVRVGRVVFHQRVRRSCAIIHEPIRSHSSHGVGEVGVSVPTGRAAWCVREPARPYFLAASLVLMRGRSRSSVSSWTYCESRCSWASDILGVPSAATPRSSPLRAASAFKRRNGGVAMPRRRPRCRAACWTQHGPLKSKWRDALRRFSARAPAVPVGIPVAAMLRTRPTAAAPLRWSVWRRASASL